MSSELYEAWLCALDKTIPSNLERRKQMEEIKLPKFKTKEELEEFAKGLAQEIEVLKSILKAKDQTIEEQVKTIKRQCSELMGKNLLLGTIDKLHYDKEKLEKENEELKKKCGIDYKEKYEVYKSWLDKEREINEKLRKENDRFLAREFTWTRICRGLIDMMPFYKRKVAEALLKSVS